MAAFINEEFEEVVKKIAACRGKMIFSGVGKSAVVAQKIVATFNSTGTQAAFMHATDAVHGDLGLVQKDDIMIILSKSGESPEIRLLLPLIKNFGNTVIAITGNTGSFLAAEAD